MEQKRNEEEKKEKKEKWYSHSNTQLSIVKSNQNFSHHNHYLNTKSVWQCTSDEMNRRQSEVKY